MTDFDAPPPNRRALFERGARDVLQRDAPPLLQRYGEGEVALGHELAQRFPSAPLLSLFRVHVIHERSRLEAATLSAQDGSSLLRVQADSVRSVQFAFQAYGMLGLTFSPGRLSDADRRHWLANLRQGSDVAFLWGAQRWDSDYLIGVPDRYHLSLYAFSPIHTEAGARLTQDTANQLIAWLESVWLT
ncbi:MAG: hypothetical protein U0452_05940 [Anaerolineae bacterium]